MTLLEKPPVREETSEPPRLPQPERARSERTGVRLVLRRVVVTALVAVSAWHGAATYLWVAPSTPIRDMLPDGVLNSYMDPMFAQAWSVFAPEPIDGDYRVKVRASVVGEDGTSRTTEWVDASAAETSQLAGTLMQSRAGIVAHKLAMKYYERYFDLSDEQRDVVSLNYYRDEWTGRLRADLEAVEGESPEVNTFLRQEWNATAYATQVARAVWGDDVEQVQYSVSRKQVAPMDATDDREAAPEPVVLDSGWRGPVVREGQNEDAFTDAFLSFDVPNLEEARDE
jgi:hypothetical protein